MRARLLSLTTFLFLSACSVLPASPPAPVVYDLGPPAGQLNAAVSLQSVDSPDWLDSTAMLYRIGDPNRVQSYRDARWAAQPSMLLSERLQQRLSPQGAVRPLSLALDVFEQRFSSATSSEVCVRARAKFAGRERVFEVKFAGGADAASGARAFAKASDALIEQVLEWAAATQ